MYTTVDVSFTIVSDSFTKQLHAVVAFFRLRPLIAARARCQERFAGRKPDHACSCSRAPSVVDIHLSEVSAQSPSKPASSMCVVRAEHCCVQDYGLARERIQNMVHSIRKSDA